MLKITIPILIIVSSKTIKSEEALCGTKKWKPGWRMFFSYYEENYQLGEMQFDSLLSVSNNYISTLINY